MPERCSTLSEAFDLNARKYGSRTFLRHKRDKAWRDCSWDRIAEAAAKLRAGLIGLGIKPSDRIAILSDNSPQWVIVDQAVLGLGATVVPLYTTSGAEETAYVMNDCGARLVAANGADMVNKILELGSSLPALAGVIAIHPGAAPQETGGLPVMTLEMVSKEPGAPIRQGKRDDLATLIYTSGTTGPPKGVMLSHGNILANCEDALQVLDLSEDDLTLSFLPVAHSFERTGGYYTVMIGGGTIAYAEGLTQIPANLLEIRPTILMVVPRMLEVIHDRVLRTVRMGSSFRQRLFAAAIRTGERAWECRNDGRALAPMLALQMAAFRGLVLRKISGIFGGRLRYLISGGAPLPVEVNRFFSAAGVRVIEGYGLTEAGPVVSVNPPRGRIKMGTVGRPLPSVKVEIAPDGELLVRGPNVMKGYFNREEQTREALDAQGWLHTGDIAQIDGDGYITITDRKKEIIVLSGGKNVSPANLERRLTNDPYVAQACVLGDRRKHLAALLVPNLENLKDVLREKGLAGRPAEEIVASPEIRSFYQARLRAFNRPLSDIERVSSFTLLARPFTQENGELTPTLKLRRKVVQEHYRDEIESMYRS